MQPQEQCICSKQHLSGQASVLRAGIANDGWCWGSENWLLSCNHASSAGMREWSPNYHQRTNNSQHMCVCAHFRLCVHACRRTFSQAVSRQLSEEKPIKLPVSNMYNKVSKQQVNLAEPCGCIHSLHLRCSYPPAGFFLFIWHFIRFWCNNCAVTFTLQNCSVRWFRHKLLNLVSTKKKTLASW